MAHHRLTMANLDDPQRLDPFGLHLTSVVHDEILDAIVRKVAKKSGASIALISLVMGRIQFFRASVGLPTELEKSRATSRCVSFCQLVVKAEKEIIITEATTDTRVPKEMVELYGIRSYIGVPIHHQGAVIGSLCAADSQPRQWPSSLPRELKAIAKELESRLDTLRERSDEEEIVAVSDLTLQLMMGAVLQDIKELEEPLTRLNEWIRSEKWLELKSTETSDEKRGSALEVAEIYRSIENAVVAMRRNVLRMADGFELRRAKIDNKMLLALRQDARSVSRAFLELGPLVRLVEGWATGLISADEFAKNAAVLREAEASAADTLDSLRRVEITARTLTEASRK